MKCIYHFKTDCSTFCSFAPLNMAAQAARGIAKNASVPILRPTPQPPRLP